MDEREAHQQRRERRAGWEVRVFRNGEADAAADYDALFRDRIPVDQRAEATWQVSEEVFELAFPGTREQRLPRSALRIVRR
jgi:hypothetical protein